MDPAYTLEYEQFERCHWWFVARREIICDTIDRFGKPSSDHPHWLDIGCGSGVLLESVAGITDKLGLELDAGSVACAQSRGLNVQQVVPAWDFREHGLFDLITLTDVIEHVEHEREAIAAARAVLKDNGVLLITVPALMSLWSSHDVVNHHFRRYTRASLLRLFPAWEWDVVKASYFSSLLLPLIWAARKWKNLRTRGMANSRADHDFKFGPMDGVFRMIFGIERPLLRYINLPLGSSILLVLRKR